MPFTTLLVDLDDTVYPAGNGVWEAIADRIDLYMVERLGLPQAEVPAIRKDLHRRFGTTLRGLASTRQVNRLDYLAFVHDIPLSQFLTPNPGLRAALLSLPQRKVIFTNADQAHAVRVLTALDLADLFEQIIDIHTIWPFCKPMPEAFNIALEKAQTRPEDCLFIDDALGNLAGARSVGLATLLVHPGAAPSDQPAIASLVELPQALSRLAAAG
jgi:putative hydrolase of the HAD superfamily